ncbi:LOW QUALITY PROTEIN: hypothetical protein TorRG33x02_204380 [Trema orientale]|uniref:Uncharacterized protein n=1 Tax=Trema orientale TaxID=63057 RepID=A0A2P5EE21_TREOI|nr:LOW QUALITY PROTEIN: hypothetical protein TorRG33x02_204380 [Trema orientale]
MSYCWSPKRVETATKVIIEALKRAQFRFRGNKLGIWLESNCGEFLVRQSLNLVIKVLEYCLERISNMFYIITKYLRYKITRFPLMKDMILLYKYILKVHNLISSNGGNILSVISVTIWIVLDSKYFIKEYRVDFPTILELDLEGRSNLYCTLVLKNSQ